MLCTVSKSAFLKQPPVPLAQKLPVGINTFSSCEPPAMPGDGFPCQYDLPAFWSWGRVVKLEHNSLYSIHSVVPEELIGAGFDFIAHS